MNIQFETERLILRPLRAEDVEEMFDYRNDERCYRYQRGQSGEKEAIGALVERRKEDMLFADGPKMMAIVLKETGKIIGETTIFLENPTITMGYTISYKHHRKGYAYELFSGLTEELHRRCPEREFICMTDPENRASMGLLRKLGFTHVGYQEAVDSEVFIKWPVEE